MDTPSTPDPHDMYVFEVRGVITCCIVCNTNKTEHLLQGVAPAPRNFSLPAPGAVRPSEQDAAAPLPACSAGSARRRTPRTLRLAAGPRTAAARTRDGTPRCLSVRYRAPLLALAGLGGASAPSFRLVAAGRGPRPPTATPPCSL